MLQPHWNQARPCSADVSKHSLEVSLGELPLGTGAIAEFLTSIRNTHANGGAVLVAKKISHDPVLDWFASRNRLLEENLLPRLMKRPEISDEALEVFAEVRDQSCGFEMRNSFEFIGHIASKLHYGGAYKSLPGDGSFALDLANAVCEQMFQRRFGEISYYVSWNAWSSWFSGVAWDYTSAIYDRRERNLWLLFVTDTD